MWETILHSIFPKILGPEPTRFGRRGNLIEIKDTPANGGAGKFSRRELGLP
jgi:hypothetical protein